MSNKLIHIIFYIFCGSIIGAQNFNLQGDAVLIAPDTYQLTDELPNEAGMMTYMYPVDVTTDFEINFEINFGDRDANGADGFAFMFSNNCNESISTSGNYGVNNMANSIIVDFDTYDNGTTNNDIAYDHIGIYKNGSFAIGGNIMDGGNTPVCLLNNCGNVEDGNWHSVKIAWEYIANNSQKISVYFDGVLRATSTKNHLNQVFNNIPLVFWSIAASTDTSFNEHLFRFNDTNIAVPTDYTYCINTPFTLTAPSNGSNFVWTNNTSTTNTASYVATQEETITCTYVDFCGITRTIEFNIHIDIPTAPVVTVPTEICLGEDVVINFTGEADHVIQYSINGNNQSITLNANGEASYTISSPTSNVQVQLQKIISPLGCETLLSDSFTTVINPLPSTPTVTNNSDICSGETATFNIQGIAGEVIDYSLNGVTSSLTLNTDGEYALSIANCTVEQTLTLNHSTNVEGCEKDLNVQSVITVLPLPVSPTINQNGPICEFDTAYFYISGGNEDDTVYYTLNGTASAVVLNASGENTISIPNASGNQILEITKIINSYGCEIVVSISETIIVHDEPQLSSISPQ